MPIVHPRAYQRAFSLNRQTNLTTSIIDGKINKGRSIRNFAPATKTGVRISDLTWTAKGHTFPTFSDEVQEDFQFPSEDHSCTDLELLYAAYFCMGNLTSSQPYPGSMPLMWRHTIRWQPVLTNQLVRSTTVVEKAGAEYTKKLIGAWVNSFTITGDRADHVVLNWDGGAAGYEDDVFSFPALSTASFFKTLFGTVSFGDSGSLGDISAEVLSFNFQFTQNAFPLHLMGNATNSEKQVSEVLIGEQQVSGAITMKINAAHRTRFLNQTLCGLRLILESPDTVNSVRKTATINIPNLQIGSESWGEEGPTIAWTMNFGAQDILKIGAAEPAEIIIDSDIDDTEIGVVA